MNCRKSIPLSPFHCPLPLRHLSRAEFDEMSRLFMFLDFHLYEGALIHFLGGETRIWQRVPLTRAGSPLGLQTIALLTDSIAFRVTGRSPDASEGYGTQLRRYLELTPLTALPWINLYHHDIQLVTITR